MQVRVRFLQELTCNSNHVSLGFAWYELAVFAEVLLLLLLCKLALPFLQNVVSQKPWDYWAYNNLAQTLIRLGKKDEGEKMLILSDSLESKNSVIDLAKNQAQSNPYNVINWIKLGDDLRSVGRKKEALDAYKSALFVDPKNEFLTQNVALFALDLKDTTSGVHLLEKVVSLNNKNVNAWFNLGIIYAHQSKYICL